MIPQYSPKIPFSEIEKYVAKADGSGLCYLKDGTILVDKHREYQEFQSDKFKKRARTYLTTD
jgi:hypothetical protein